MQAPREEDPEAAVERKAPQQSEAASGPPTRTLQSNNLSLVQGESGAGKKNLILKLLNLTFPTSLTTRHRAGTAETSDQRTESQPDEITAKE